MKFCSIASGSSGNCIYIGEKDTHILVDTGISKKRIEQGLEELGLCGDDITAIFITHEHADHIQGLGVFSRRYQVPIYATKGTIEGILEYKGLGKMPEGLLHEIKKDTYFEMEDMKIYPFGISHDAKDPTGYRLETEQHKVAIATDLGIYNDYIVQNLQGLDGILLEANHDVHMLEVGPYPYPLKQRVLGNRGHLSNELSGRLLCDIMHDNLKFIVLGHLSKENNFPELAIETVKLEVTLGEVPYRGEDLPLSVAERDTVSNLIQL